MGWVYKVMEVSENSYHVLKFRNGLKSLNGKGWSSWKSLNKKHFDSHKENELLQMVEVKEVIEEAVEEKYVKER